MPAELRWTFQNDIEPPLGTKFYGRFLVRAEMRKEAVS
jgi:hypothetical protein